MPIPVCFMVMPFGKKLTNVDSSKYPGQIDFDALWEKALRPMILEDLKYLPIRADQDAGTLIIKAMIERLAISDLVIADLTIPNANVYYEVGVRHTAKGTGCVLIAAEWSKPLFDMVQMRRVAYPLANGEITDADASEVRSVLKDQIAQVIDNLSPVFETLPGFPGTLDTRQLQSFRDVAERLAKFQSEIAVARGLSANDSATEVARLAELYQGDAGTIPSVALDLVLCLRDTRRWEAGIRFIDGLPQRIRQLPAIREQRALMLGKSGRHLDAISEIESLIRMEGDTSERSGLLGGRYKVLFEVASDALTKSNYLNKAIASYERGMMLDLNDYFPSSNLPRLYRERKQPGDEQKASASANAAQLACERSTKRNSDDPWALPAMLGAAFDAGDFHSARRLLDTFNQATVAPFPIESTIPDLRRALSLLADETASSKLALILREFQEHLEPNGTVTALAGRRIDADNRGVPRFPPENEAIVARRIRDMLIATASKTLVCSAACGADILALEVASGLGLSRRVILPFLRARFRATSVADRGEEWGRRFDAVLSQLSDKDIVELSLQGSDDEAYSMTNIKIIDEAISMASATDRHAFAVVVWDGLSRGKADHTEAFRRLATEQQLELVRVRTL